MRLYDLVLKDIKNIIYDVKSLAIIVLMPIVLMSILGLSLQGVFGEETESGVAMAHIGVVKAYDMEEEMAKVAGRIDLANLDADTLEGLNAEKNFFALLDNDDIKGFLTYELMAPEAGIEALEAGAITALVTLPKNFVYNSYMMLEGSRLVSEIDYKINPENDFYANIVLGIIDSYVEITNHIYAQQRLLVMTLMSQGRMDALEAMDGVFDVEVLEDGAIDLVVRATQREESISSFQYYAAAIMCMFLLYTAGIGGRALLMEKNEGTVARLSVGGHGIAIMVISNFVRVMFMAMIQSAIMIFYSNVVLGVDWGDGQTVILTIILSSFAVASLGMFIAVVTLIANNYKVANVFEFGVVYIMALVGGSFIPVEGLPPLLQELGFLSINGLALKMYINGMYALPIGESVTYMIAMILFGSVFIIGSMLLVARKGRALAC